MTDISESTHAGRNKPAAKDRLHRREWILNAAIRSFASRGFEGSTWKIIAEAAGVTQGLIRFYFGDKETLWREAVQRARDDRIAHMPPSAVQDGHVDRAGVERWLRAYAEHVARFPEEARILTHEAQFPTERLRWAAERFMREDADAFIEAVRTLQAQGWFPGMDPHALRYMMVGAAQYKFLVPGEAELLTGQDPRTDEGIKRHVDAVVALFMTHAGKP